ncbi:hypothetical protein FQR65_LT13412 [Abscondita terminalis]|nr:hypothetical protein FQR65_LT13412 [Abscondita terminalis]
MSRHTRNLEDISPLNIKRSPEYTGIKRKKDVLEVDENMSDNANEKNKRANFSAITSNGINRNLNDYREQTWSKLEEAVLAIQTSTGNEYSLEELYQAVENMCNHKMAHTIYNNLRRLTDHHIALMYWQNAHIPSIWDMGLDLFRQYIMANALVQTRIVEGLLMLIEKERQGDAVDRTLLKSLLRMLTDLQIYQKAFEDKFLLATERLYASEGMRLMQEMEVPQYLAHVEKRLTEEMKEFYII